MLRARLEPDSIVHADTLDVYDLLDFLGRRNQRVKRSERAVQGLAQIGGVENFWSQARRNLRKYNGIPPHHFHLFLKECEWRFNYGSPRQLSETLARWITEKT
jgi:transposase